MALGNPFKLLQKLERKPPMVSANVIKGHLTDEDKKLLQSIGISAGQLFERMHADVAVNYDRARFYNEITRAVDHWMIGPAVELYADYSTNFSALHNASVWVTSENPTYQRVLTKMLDDIGIEEKIFDWAWNTGAFGDLFVRINGMPGIGIVSINDDEHPINMSRVDHNGCLIGFFETPQGEAQGSPSNLIPPWDVVHFRTLGAKRKRPQFGDPTYCLRGNTKVHLLDGTEPTIAEMAEKPEWYVGKSVWSVNPGTLKLEPDKIVDVKKTRIGAELVRVHLDNDQWVDTTPDHRFMLRGGSYKAAGMLQPGDSLMPLKEVLLLNHKVIQVEILEERDDTYDLMTEKNHNFPLSCGVFVHNSEFRASYLMTGADSKQVTSRYGTSIIINSLAAYKRLRLAEDSLLMARLTRGVIRYVWKLKVDSNNQESVNELMSQLVGMLKKARALDTSPGSPNFDSKFGPLSAVEDLLIPVWGDTGDLTYDKIGGEVDIRWIVDIEELRNQLACTLRVPLSVLGGYIQEASGSLGAQAIEKLSIEFAHTARRLQRAIKTGIKRMCQVHLAYLNMDPDPRLFDVCMTETSTAEEETIKETLDTGVDVIQKMMDAAEAADENVDKVKIFNYLNKKILKLDDFDLNDFMKTTPKLEAGMAGVEPGAEGMEPSIDQMKSDLENAEELKGEAGPPEKVPESRRKLVEVKGNDGEYVKVGNPDLVSYLPITENCGGIGRAFNGRWRQDWIDTWQDVKIKVEK